MSDEEDYTNIRNRGGNSSASSRESSPQRGNKRSFSPTSDDDFVVARDDDDNTPPPQTIAQAPLIRKPLAFQEAITTAVPMYEPTPPTASASTPAFLPGQGPKPKRKRKKPNEIPAGPNTGAKKTANSKKAQAKQIPSFKLSNYGTDREPTPAPEPVSTLGVVSGGPYNSAFRISEDAPQSYYRSHVYGSPQPSGLAQVAHPNYLPSQQEIPRQTPQPLFIPNSYSMTGPPGPVNPVVHPIPAVQPLTHRPSLNPTLHAMSQSPAPRSFSPAVMSPIYAPTHDGIGSGTEVSTTVQSTSASARSVTSTPSSGAHQSIHHEHQNAFSIDDATEFNYANDPPNSESQPMPSPSIAPLSEQAPRPSLPSPRNTLPARDSPARSMARQPVHKRTVTLLIHDQRSGVTDSQLAEVFVTLRPAEDPSDGYWADATNILEQLQNSPARIDGPAKLYTMRGKYRQFLLRVSAEQINDIAKASINICPDRTLDLVVELIQPPGAPILPPKIPKELLYAPEPEADEVDSNTNIHEPSHAGGLSQSVPPSSSVRVVRSAV